MKKTKEKCPFCPKMLAPAGRWPHIASMHKAEYREMKKVNGAAHVGLTEHLPAKAQPASTQVHLEAARDSLSTRRLVLSRRLDELKELQLEERVLEREQQVVEQALAALTVSEGTRQTPEEHPTVSRQGQARSHAMGLRTAAE